MDWHTDQIEFHEYLNRQMIQVAFWNEQAGEGTGVMVQPCGDTFHLRAWLNHREIIYFDGELEAAETALVLDEVFTWIKTRLKGETMKLIMWFDLLFKGAIRPYLYIQKSLLRAGFYLEMNHASYPKIIV